MLSKSIRVTVYFSWFNCQTLGPGLQQTDAGKKVWHSTEMTLFLSRRKGMGELCLPIHSLTNTVQPYLLVWSVHGTKITFLNERWEARKMSSSGEKDLKKIDWLLADREEDWPTTTTDKKTYELLDAIIDADDEESLGWKTKREKTSKVH